MPRALTEQEKCRLCQRLLDKGRDLLYIHGVKKISVDDIVKAADMAKGSFYHHFESKEKYLYQLIVEIRTQIFNEMSSFLSKNTINNETEDLKIRTRDFLMYLFHLPQMKFFLKYCNDVNELFMVVSDDFGSENDIHKTCYIDANLFGELIELSGIDTSKIKSGVMHNFMHTLYLMIECNLMIEDDLPRTFELIMDSLIQYILNEAGSCITGCTAGTESPDNNN